MRFLRARASGQGGSMPLALMAVIVVAGIVAVLTARTVAGERATRFDRSFTEAFHTADAGVQQAIFRLNAGVFSEGGAQELPPKSGWTAPETFTIGDDTYSWQVKRDGYRSWVVRSTGVQQEVSRTVEVNITEQPMFYPGAFGDTLIALNGNSSHVDSYNSDNSCVEGPAACEWGTDDDYGTGNGALATNGTFDFAGTTIRPGSAFLYDWIENPPDGATPDDPFGDRCDGTGSPNPCTEEHVSTVDEKLDYASDERMKFIFDALEDCDGPGQDLDAMTFGGKGKHQGPTEIAPYVADSSWTVTDPTHPDFVNYYCADSLQFLSDTDLDGATGEHPVIIFVRDFVTVDKVNVACPVTGNQCRSNKTTVPELRASDTRPEAARLQIYVAGSELNDGKKGANVTYNSQSVFAGVLYGPRSRCGSPGGAGVDIFGAIICGAMDNVGNWRFHYDDQLGRFGTGIFGAGYYTEEPGETVSPSP